MKLATTAMLIVIAALSGCSKPTDAVIPSDMTAWDKELAPELKKLPEADREKVAAYLMRAKMTELRPVCPNCHSMLHKSDPPFSIEELREVLQRGNDT